MTEITVYGEVRGKNSVSRMIRECTARFYRHPVWIAIATAGIVAASLLILSCCTPLPGREGAITTTETSTPPATQRVPATAASKATPVSSATPSRMPSHTSTSVPTRTTTPTPTATQVVVSTPANTPTPTWTAVLTRTSTDEPIQVATPTDVATARWFSAPVPLAPENGAHYSGWDALVILEWTSVGELAADEYYVIHIPYQGGVGEFWRKATLLQVHTHYSSQDVGFPDRHYNWSVQVMRCTDQCDRALNDNVKKQGVAMGDVSEEGLFYWYYVPTGQSADECEDYCEISP